MAKKVQIYSYNELANEVAEHYEDHVCSSELVEANKGKFFAAVWHGTVGTDLTDASIHGPYATREEAEEIHGDE